MKTINFEKEIKEMSIYICPECGNDMVWENRLLGALVCENCGFGINADRYGKSDEDDDYDEYYPDGDDEDSDDSGEDYEEVYDELSHALDS